MSRVCACRLRSSSPCSSPAPGRTLKNFIDLAAEGELPIDIRLVISSTANAGGLKFAEEAGIPHDSRAAGRFSSRSGRAIKHSATRSSPPAAMPASTTSRWPAS